jgi:predicted dehydrogenase
MAKSSGSKVNVGIVGAGNISEVYLKNLTTVFDNVNVVGIADLLVERARDRAKTFGVGAYSVDELIAHPDVEIVVNLTIPAAHARIALDAIAAGKSAYNEKPLAISREDGRKLLAEAAAKGVRVGSAPDTFLGGGLQSARKYLDDGIIGEPVAVSAFMLNHGMESWHPDPFFFFQPGAGPLFDVGVYYVQALASIIGPVKRVSAIAAASFPERVVGSGPKKGEVIPVNTPTHIMASLEFESGIVGALGSSFDVWESHGSTLVIYGSEGTLRLPDPNTFGGPIQHLKAGERTWTDLPLVYGNTGNSRGLGVWDLANAMQTGGKHRASGELGYHTLDIMASVLESSERGQHVKVESTLERPALLPA